MEWINFNKHKGIFQAVISSSKKELIATNIWTVDTNLRRQNCHRTNKFYIHLKEESVSEDDYAHAHKVWNELNTQNIRQYHDLCLTLDVLLLADVFENFRRMFLNYYELDSCNYYTLPGLSFNARLKMTKIELELLCDPEQFLFVEK